MKPKAFLVSALVLLSLGGAARGADTTIPGRGQERVQNWDDFARDMREWVNRWWSRFGGGLSREERPLISLMLSHRERLGLSPDQIRQLEGLRDDFERESIRKDADLRIAELDLDKLLDSVPVDMAKVEAKIRDIEKLRADLRFARIRAVEKGKEQLTPEQRTKLQDILGEPPLPRPRPRSER
jgi:hypothetical protein